MIKNIIFDIGNVILNFNLNDIIPNYATNQEEHDFIIKNIINSPEWLEYGLIDSGYLNKEDAVKLVQDRTNHTNDELVYHFWNSYMDYSFLYDKVVNLIKQLKSQGYKVFLLSNINQYTHQSIEHHELFKVIDGAVLSYQVHQLKPYKSIYQTLLLNYNLKPEECLFVDDRESNLQTANSLGIQGEAVKPDDYSSIIELLDKYKIKY